ncbi:alpha/beta hydrolase family protein [Vibrio ouci]|uniref:Alpha/beta hydrolase n=1 Tax=Vibrio ouci TaxID=2499078 RepID=A0A4Y8WA29_9VIBR|nr:alpha/beta hydrolase [Vibrio ouci]TFH89789.1 alpha/beta hydrolase [Vibrio ouci]
MNFYELELIFADRHDLYFCNSEELIKFNHVSARLDCIPYSFLYSDANTLIYSSGGITFELTGEKISEHSYATDSISIESDGEKMKYTLHTLDQEFDFKLSYIRNELTLVDDGIQIKDIESNEPLFELECEMLSFSPTAVLVKVEELNDDRFMVIDLDSLVCRPIDIDGLSAMSGTISKDNVMHLICHKNGLQKYVKLDLDQSQSTLEHVASAGVINLFSDGNKIHYSTFGTTEGYQVFNGNNDAIVIDSATWHYNRQYINYDDLNVIALTNPKFTKAAIFFHGGPESVEFDEIRYPILRDELFRRGFNVYIVNYIGSTNFGRNFRCKYDGDLIRSSLLPIESWINQLGEHLILLVGGSYGGTLALQLAGTIKHQTVTIAVCPLIDMNEHIDRVQRLTNDTSFFANKFGARDRAIATNGAKFFDSIRESKIQFIFGRNDEVICHKNSIRRVLEQNNTNHTVTVDNFGHSDNLHERQYAMIRYIEQHT